MPIENFRGVPLEVPYTLDQLKQAFWHEAICFSVPSHKVRRLVARTISWGSGSDEGADHGTYEIFAPTSYDDDYDLVLSLATDGYQYPIIDCDVPDMATVLERHKFTTIVPSTNNYHVYYSNPTDWEVQVEMLKKENNSGYLFMNESKGWCGLRPPWLDKNGDLNQRAFNSTLFRRFTDPTKFLDKSTPPEPEGVSLDDLFGEE